MVVFPKCKINLGLNVVEKRRDGFHNIETCFFPLAWTDVLEAIPADNFSFQASGLSIPGEEKNNLCLQAFDLLKADFDIQPVAVYLHKIIPMGAGLGGGSSDAARMLLLLNNLCALGLDTEALKAYATKLGSDCSFFLYERPMLGSGRGDTLENISCDLRGKFIVVVKPPVHVSTAEAYSGILPKRSAISVRDIIENYNLTEWRHYLKNDFEESVFQKFPEIGQIKKQLYEANAVYASMSGSGSAVFAIFNEPVDLKNSFPSCNYWSGSID
jgi:4-diphosphocytidyl-2-C-methyl-D-erythritol kinase